MLPNLDRLKPGSTAVVGFPFDAYSSFLHGAAEAPRVIRETFLSPSSNLWTETGVNLGEPGLFTDVGDVGIVSAEGAFSLIESVTEKLLARDVNVVSLGGDHSITYPIIRAFARRRAPISILHFDAHPDLYEEFDGNRFSHACPFARIMESGLVKRLVQVGIRTMTGELRRQIVRYGVEVIEMRNIDAARSLTFDTPIYISFDLDALDPAFAPGVSHPEAGGLTTREVLAILHSLKTPIVGADIVEYNPRRDSQGITAAACARLLKEIIGLIHLNKANEISPAR